MHAIIAGGLDGVATDPNRLPWQPINRFGPHFGIRPLLDQSESMGSSGISRNIFIWVLARVGTCRYGTYTCFGGQALVNCANLYKVFANL